MPDRITLPAALYDTLQAEAQRWGGVGGEQNFQQQRDKGWEPWCAHGLLRQARGLATGWDQMKPVPDLVAAGLPVWLSDAAVQRCNERRGVLSPNARIPFPDWCAAANVVRGP